MSRPRVFSGAHFVPKQKCSTCNRLSQCQANQFSATLDDILFDCKGFYYVFSRIEKFDRYPFFSGEDMKMHLDEVKQYEEKHKGVPCLLMAQAANGALAVELALKYFHFKENHSFSCIHNIKVLFNDLPEPHKSALTSKIHVELCQNTDSLEKSLERISGIFEHARYSFSHNEGFGFTSFFTGFVHIVCDYALSFAHSEGDVLTEEKT